MLLATPAPPVPVAGAATTISPVGTPPAPSYYLGDLSPERLRHRGSLDELVAAAGGLTHAVVVLDAGDPATEPGATLLPDGRGEASPQLIARAVSAYAQGWALDPAGVPLTLVVGTSNSGHHVDARHGTAWGGLVATVAAAAPGVDVRGGLDAEPDYNPAAATLAFVRGYLDGTTRPFVDFGDCACTAGQALPKGWTLRQRAEVARAGSVLPEQYRTSSIDAERWAHLDRSVRPQHLDVLGVLTEVSACVGPPVRDCRGIDQRPEVARAALSEALGRPVPGTTDIGYLTPLPTRSVAVRETRIGFGVLGAALVVGAGGVGLRRLLRRPSRRRRA